MRAVLLYVSLAWLHLSLGFLARDTGSKEVCAFQLDESKAKFNHIPTHVCTAIILLIHSSVRI